MDEMNKLTEEQTTTSQSVDSNVPFTRKLTSSATLLRTNLTTGNDRNKLVFYIIMAVMIVIAIVGVIAVALASSNDESKYLGTWDIHSVSIEGSSFTIEEIEAMGDYSMSDFRIIIKEGGKAWIHSDGSGATVDWEKTSTGIKIGVRECSFENELLSIENNDIIIYLAKTSDSQIVSKPKTDNDANDDNNLDDNNENEVGEITEEELLLVKNIAESTNSKLDTYVSLATEYEYSGKKISLLMNSCDVNWNDQAVINAEKEAASCDKTSPKRLISYLEYHDFDNSEIDYALENCQIDWVEQAFLFIQDLLTYEVKWGNRDGWYGPTEIRMALDEEWFDWDTITYIESQIDWQEQVKLYIQHLSSFFPKFNRLDARGILGNGILANDAGISSVLETSGVDWKEHAFNIANEFYEENVGSWYYENRPTNAIYEDMEIELLEVWDFTDEEVEYAINKVKECHRVIP